jgi:DNA-binding winged helix-turn-helix (wHTH) protein
VRSTSGPSWGIHTALPQFDLVTKQTVISTMATVGSGVMMKRRQHAEGIASGTIGHERPRASAGASRVNAGEASSSDAVSGIFAAAPTVGRLAQEHFDLAASVIRVDGELVYLRPMERRLIALLMASPNRVVTTEDVVASLYGGISLDAGRVRLKRLVADIRKRLGETFSRDLRTIHRVGLVLVVADVAQAPELDLAD